MQKPGNRRKTEVHSNQNRLKEVVHSALNPVDLIHQLRFSLEQEWKSKNIPYNLCEIYSAFISLLPHRKSVIFMQKEISDLRSYNSLVQICLKGISAREESLNSIKEMCQYLEKADDWHSLIDVKVECAEILHAHRMLTLNVAESIERWKDFFLFENSEFKAYFIYNGSNYLEKMKYDLDFIHVSELSKAFKFSTENDPFLLYPSKIVEKPKGKLASNYFIQNGQVIIPLPSLILKRVEKMDEMIKNELGNAEVKGNKDLEIITANAAKIANAPNHLSLNPAPARIGRDKNHKVVSNTEKTQDNIKIAKGLAEDIYRDVIKFATLEIVNEQVVEFIAKSLSFDIEPALEPCIEIIVAEVLREFHALPPDSGYTQFSKYENFNSESEALSSRPAVESIIKLSAHSKSSSQSSESRDSKHNKDSSRPSSKESMIIKDMKNPEIKIDPEDLPKPALDTSENKSKKALSPPKLHADHSYLPNTSNPNSLKQVKSHPSPVKLKPYEEPNPPSPAITKPSPVKKQFPNAETESERRSTLNAKRLQQFSIIEWIIRNMIEKMIQDINLEKIVNSSIQDVLAEQSKKAGTEERNRLSIIMKTLEMEKVYEMVYFGVVDSFVELEWVEQIAKSLLEFNRNPNRRRTFEPLVMKQPQLVVEEIEDFALEVFTPGVHSPNQINSEESDEEVSAKISHTSDMLHKIISQGRANGKYEVVPFNENLKNALNSIKLYIENLPPKIRDLNWSSDEIMSFLEFSQEPSFYWLKDEFEITGCIIYSNLLYKGNKSTLVHHFSTINPNNMKILFEKSSTLASSRYSRNLIFNLKREKIKDLLSLLSIVKFETITLSFPPTLKESSFHSISLPDNFSVTPSNLFFSLRLFSSNTITTSNSFNTQKPIPVKEMKLIGNRHCTLSALLSLSEDPQDITPANGNPIRLQTDLIDLIEIISSLDNFKYPCIETTHDSDSISTSSISLNINFNNTSTFSMTFDKSSYKFIKVLNVNKYQSEQWSLFEFNTLTPGLKAFVLVYQNLTQEIETEIKNCRSDLFSKIENLLKALPENAEKSNVVFPGFKFSADCDLPWMNGITISDSSFITRCSETTNIEMNFPEQEQGMLKTTDCISITSDFVFGLRDDYITQVLELPFVVSFISKSNWIHS